MPELVVLAKLRHCIPANGSPRITSVHAHIFVQEFPKTCPATSTPRGFRNAMIRILAMFGRTWDRKVFIWQ